MTDEGSLMGNADVIPMPVGRLRVNRVEFERVLKSLGEVIPEIRKRTGTVVVGADDKHLTVTAADNDLLARLASKAHVARQDRVAVKAQALRAALKKMGTGEIIVNIYAGDLVLLGETRQVVPALDPPEWEGSGKTKVAETFEMRLASKDLAGALESLPGDSVLTMFHPDAVTLHDGDNPIVMPAECTVTEPVVVALPTRFWRATSSLTGDFDIDLDVGLNSDGDMVFFADTIVLVGLEKGGGDEG